MLDSSESCYNLELQILADFPVAFLCHRLLLVVRVKFIPVSGH